MRGQDVMFKCDVKGRQFEVRYKVMVAICMDRIKNLPVNKHGSI